MFVDITDVTLVSEDTDDHDDPNDPDDTIDLADYPAMSFLFFCWQINIRNTNQLSWAINYYWPWWPWRFILDVHFSCNIYQNVFLKYLHVYLICSPCMSRFWPREVFLKMLAADATVSAASMSALSLLAVLLLRNLPRTGMMLDDKDNDDSEPWWTVSWTMVNQVTCSWRGWLWGWPDGDTDRKREISS